jgi:8-oxo-dGTP diphosphatase
MTVLLSQPGVKGRKVHGQGVSVAWTMPDARSVPAGRPDRRPTIPCVGAVVHDERGRLLMVRRANPPAQGTWSLPGGKVEQGEDDAAAAVREVAEETGLHVMSGPVVGTVERDAPGGGLFLITDLVCTVIGGTLHSGDDASDAGWFDARTLAAASTSPGLVEALTAWGVMPL